MRALWLVLLCLMLAGCTEESTVLPETSAVTAPTTHPEATTLPEPSDPVGDILAGMTVEEKVGQLLLARCEDSRAPADIEALHLGGLVLFARDFEAETPDSLREKLQSYQASAKIPLLLAVDEEGGTVTRVSRFPAFRESPFPSPREAREFGGLGWALVNEDEKTQLLKDLGLNVNLGPVCDLSDDPADFMYQRSLGLGPEDTGFFAAQTVKIMAAGGIGSVLKHFPGYGGNADTHVGMARDSRSLEALESRDLRPFEDGIRAGAGGILVSHNIVEALDPDLPASLSPAVHRYLREEMAFEGVILTDDLAMEAITEAYGPGEAAILAVQAGNDLLCATDYVLQYEALLEAVEDGRIEADVLDQAVRNVLEWKLDLGLIE